MRQRIGRRTIPLLLVAAMWAGGALAAERSPADLQPAQPLLGACGVERWAVKTLSDPAARRVSYRPRITTVSALRRLRQGASSLGQRSRPVELTTYRVRARLVSMKLEADSDVHLVIGDLRYPSRTMIVELPLPACVRSAPFRRKRQIAQARAALVRACRAPGTSFEPLSGTAMITGVGFFDELHGQTGVAPNGIELHPVLAFASRNCR